MTNAEMITQAIADMNAERERAAQSQIRAHINKIATAQARKATMIAELDAEIAEAKKALAAVTIVPVIATDIVG